MEVFIMRLGQAINYLNPRSVQKFMITAYLHVPELKLRPGNFKVCDRYDESLKGEVLDREVISIDCVNNMVNFEIE